jgi:hypothetical protein
LCWGDTCVQVSSNLVTYSLRIKFGKKWVDFERSLCFHRPPTGQCLTWSIHYSTYSLSFQRPPVGQCLILSDNVWKFQIISDWQFQPDVRSLFWPYFANWVSVWSHSSFAGLVTLWGSFISYWLVFLITLFQGVLLGVLNIGHRSGSIERILLGSRSPPLVTSSVLQLVSEPDMPLVALHMLCDWKAI